MPKNLVLIVVDQMRADALSINDPTHFVSTPTLDMMASQGHNFTNMYSVVPSCIPARVALLSGLKQGKTGRVGYEEGIPWNFTHTLAQSFKEAGYQTQCIGKMHVYPSRKRMGFDHVLLHDGYLHVDRKYDQPYGLQFEQSSDYLHFLKQEVGNRVDIIDSGLHCNSWEARPWQLEEYLHPTNWVVSEAIQFLKRRDPTTPFFLKMSFEKPHAPLDPPAYYFDMYMERLAQEPDLHIGNWETYKETPPGIYALKGRLKADDQRRMLAGYFGLVSHLDHQISRFLTALKEFRHDKDTVIAFVSDHGDQLGEHYLFRKGYPYQGSINVPFFLYDPSTDVDGSGTSHDDLVTLRDVYPTLTDWVLGEVPPVDGRSLVPLVEKKPITWRTLLFGEHSLGEDSSQFIISKEWKFIWYSVRDDYQLFHLADDPFEQNNLSHNPSYSPIIADFKERLIKHLKDREEGFVVDGTLRAVGIEQIRPVLSKVTL